LTRNNNRKVQIKKLEIMGEKLLVEELSGNKKIIYDEVKKIYDIEKKITPSKILELAKDPNHPLHVHFEWDDEVAANKYRLIQARDLINQILITIINEDKSRVNKVRAFLSFSENDKSEMVINGNQYTDNYFLSIEDIDKDEKKVQHQKLKAKSELKAFQVKYSFLNTYLGNIFTEIDKL
jgi:hypothetical protein